MAKKKRRKGPQNQKESAQIPKSSWSSWQLKLLGICIILFVLVIQHAPMVFDGLSPIGTDIIGGKGGTHQIEQFEKETGTPALWNPYVFSGMPVYYRLRLKGPFLQEIIYWFANTDKKGLNAVINYCIGGIGMFLLIQYLGVPIWGSVLAARCGNCRGGGDDRNRSGRSHCIERTALWDSARNHRSGQCHWP